jgi:ribonuclease PH
MNSKKIVRNDGRTPEQLRPVSFSRGIYEYAAGSFLFEMGKTKVLCAVSMQPGVPQFLRGKGTGWLTAEYALLPTSTTTRTQRENALKGKDGRTVEIARFIGRCFRSVVDLSTIGERTITIDCDVLQADGGTRTASITGAFLALLMAQEKWLQSRLITKPIVMDNITAVSVGIVRDNVFLDLNYEEDSVATADFNFVITQSNKIIEMQGGAESAPVSWETFEAIRLMACSGAQKLFMLYNKDTKEQTAQDDAVVGQKVSDQPESERAPLFSLKNRLQSL